MCYVCTALLTNLPFPLVKTGFCAVIDVQQLAVHTTQASSSQQSTCLYMQNTEIKYVCASRALLDFSFLKDSFSGSGILG